MPDSKNDENGSGSQAPDSNAPGPFKGEEYVRWAYRLLLGREPESLETIQNNPLKNDRQRLVEAILRSGEFQRCNSFNLPLSGARSFNAEFDINKLRRRDLRWDNIGELRRWTKAVPMGDGTILCRTL